MLKVLVVLAIIIGLAGHFVPIKSFIQGPTEKAEQVTTKYRMVNGRYTDYKKATQDILCNITCENKAHRLYLW